MDISKFVCDTWTREQKEVYQRITEEKESYPNCVAAALGYLGIETGTAFNPGKAFPFIEGISETTEAPEFGALVVWYSNPISLMTHCFYTTPVRHAGLVLGTRNDFLYVFDQMRGSLHGEPISVATQRVDAFSKERYGEKYAGITEVKYHPLEAVLAQAQRIR
ncbi:hypothetical protein HZA99_04415 [Candidatus Woesearchaeota archaeon]|nr:hypothetical protein [Candidatus Woesearchaeota archaeon]